MKLTRPCRTLLRRTNRTLPRRWMIHRQGPFRRIIVHLDNVSPPPILCRRRCRHLPMPPYCQCAMPTPPQTWSDYQKSHSLDFDFLHGNVVGVSALEARTEQHVQGLRTASVYRGVRCRSITTWTNWSIRRASAAGARRTCAFE